ncbi:hypothetical protein, unknown function [Leishmania tarentolae]|uniref:Uncharacterized protein n=1 Tax=Leishmania tarentolae TaxID=5689 RepID=A0A640KPE6_LEITA|nr:hypothetical protein, unknown function [Leishmania tarentolae]
MSSAGQNICSGGHRGRNHSRTDKTQADIKSAAHFDPNSNDYANDLKLLPLCAQISNMQFDGQSPSETFTSAVLGADFSHAPGTGVSFTSFSTSTDSLRQPSQVPSALSFHNLHSDGKAAVDGSPRTHDRDNEDRRWRKEKSGFSQQDCQTSRDIRSPPWPMNNYPLSSFGCHKVAPAPLSSFVTAPYSDVTLQGVSGAYSNYLSGVFGTSEYRDGALQAATALPQSVAGKGASSVLQQAHHSSHGGTANAGGERCSNIATADGNEYVMSPPHPLQALLYQQQQESTAQVNGFMPFGSPRTNALRELKPSSTTNNTSTMSAMSACLMQLMSRSGNSTDGQTTPSPLPQPLFALNSLPSSLLSTNLMPQVPQNRNIIKPYETLRAQPFVTSGAGIVYANAPLEGSTATKSLTSTRVAGNSHISPDDVFFGSLGQTSFHPHHFTAPSHHQTVPTKDSDREAQRRTFAPAALLAAMNPLCYGFSSLSNSGAVSSPVLPASMYSPCTGAVTYSQPGLLLPTQAAAVQSQYPLKPTRSAGKRHTSRGRVQRSATEDHDTSGGGNNRKSSRRQQGDDSDHARNQNDAAAHKVADAQPEPKNGANFLVGAWYEGVVKRYNPLRGFGFLTCTHELHVDLHSCERACTRQADAVYEKQLQRELEEAAAVVTADTRTALQSAKGGEREQDEQKLQSLSDSRVTLPGDTRAAPLLASNDAVKERDRGRPHLPVTTDDHSDSDDDAVASASTTGTKEADVSDAADASLSSATVTASTSKAHGTVVYSTMQWYLRMVDAAAKRTCTEEAAAMRNSEDDAYDGKHNCLVSLDDFGMLEREPAQLGDIFVHHSSISMEGFRVFVQGTAVRFSVAVLMGTVQAVDVIPLGPEWEKPLSLEELAQPPLYKVTPTAATVLRYHRVGGIPVQWSDMAVVPSPAIPNSVEGSSELMIVRVPPKTGQTRFQKAVTSTRSGSTTEREAVSITSTTTASTNDDVDTSQSTHKTELVGPMLSTVATARTQVSDENPNESMYTYPNDALRGGPQLFDVVHSYGTAATLLAMETEEQTVLQENPGSPGMATIPPAPAEKREVLDEKTKVTQPATLSAEEVKRLANSTPLENMPSNSLNREPSALCVDGLTNSKRDRMSGEGNTGDTATQTSARDTRNRRMTTATTTNLMRSGGYKTGVHSSAAQNSMDEQKDRCGCVSHTTGIHSLGECKRSVSSNSVDEQTSSYPNGHDATSMADKDLCEVDEGTAALDRNNTPAVAHSTGPVHEGHEGPCRFHGNQEYSTDGAAASMQEAAVLPANGDFSDSRPHEDVDVYEVDVRSHSGGGIDEDKNGSLSTTTTSANEMSDAIPVAEPEQAEVFTLDIPNERAQASMMHKTAFKLLPLHSLQSMVKTETLNPVSRSRVGCGATAHVPEMLPPISAGDVDGSSSRNMHEKDRVAEASDSRGATDHGSNSPETGAAHLTVDAVNGNGDMACRRTRTPTKGSSVGGQQKRPKKKTVPALMMVDVTSLPPKLAAQVPPGVVIIALPHDTVKRLKIKAMSVPRGSTSEPASPRFTEVQFAIPASGGPSASCSKAHLAFHGLVQTTEAGHVSCSRALRSDSSSSSVPAHGHSGRAGIELHRQRMVAMDKGPTSIGSTSLVESVECSDLCSPQNGGSLFPFTMTPPQSQPALQPYRTHR